MPHLFRIKAAWTSYLAIQIFWVLCVVLVPVALTFYPAKLCAMPFCAVTIAGGLHMTHYRYEYNALLRRIVRLFPFERFVLRYLTPAQRDPKHFGALGILYAMVGFTSAALIFMA